MVTAKRAVVNINELRSKKDTYPETASFAVSIISCFLEACSSLTPDEVARLFDLGGRTIERKKSNVDLRSELFVVSR